jgi:hypothetical protein
MIFFYLTNIEEKNTYPALVGESERKRPLGKSKYR